MSRSASLRLDDPEGVMPSLVGPAALSVEPIGVAGVCQGASFALNGGVRRVATWSGQALRARGLGDLPLAFEFGGEVFDLTFRDVGVRATVDGGRIDTLVLGGRITIDELVPVLAPIYPTQPEDRRRLLLEGGADLEPNFDGVCQALSFVFEAQL